MDLFEMFGVCTEPAPKKEEKKKPVKKEKKSSKNVTSSKETFDCPMSVITDYGEVKVMEEGKKTEGELIKILADRYSLPAGKCALQKKGKKVLFSVNREKVAAKGEIEVGPETALYVANRQRVDVSGLLTSEKSEGISFGKLGTYLADTVSPLFSMVTAFSSGENEVTVIPAVMSRTELDTELSKMTFPFQIGQIDGNVFEVQEDYYESVLKEAGKEISGEKETGMLYEDVKVFIEKQYPHFKGEAVFNACSDKNEVLVFVDAKPAKKMASSTGKSQMIPTEGTEISLIFTKIKLSPEMFGGKTEVGKGEIVKVLGKMYPEYSPARTTIEYDSDAKLIVPILKGASKGCDIPGFNPELPYEKWEEWKHGFEYRLFRTEKDGVSYQAEITPISSVLAPMERGEDGEFLWKIEKIPCEIMCAIKEFFLWVYQKYGTEVLVHLWYHPENGYTVTLPVQWVTEDSVHAEMTACTTVQKGSILVADIHSHGRYRAFYSRTDDEDEQGNRLYGVLGGFDVPENYSCCLRTGTRGYFIGLEYSDVVRSDCFDMKCAEKIIEDLKGTESSCLRGVR